MSAYRDDQRALVERLQRENARLREGRRWPLPPFAAWVAGVAAWVLIALVTGDWLAVAVVGGFTSGSLFVAWMSGHEAGDRAARERGRQDEAAEAAREMDRWREP